MITGGSSGNRGMYVAKAVDVTTEQTFKQLCGKGLDDAQADFVYTVVSQGLPNAIPLGAAMNSGRSSVRQAFKQGLLARGEVVDAAMTQALIAQGQRELKYKSSANINAYNALIDAGILVADKI